MDLKALLTQLRALAGEPGTARIAEIRAHLAGIEGLEPADIEAAATAEFQTIHDAADFTEENFTSMGLLADLVDATREMTAEREEAEAQTADNVAALLARITPAAEAGTEGDDPAADTDPPVGGDSGAESAPAVAPQGELVRASTRAPATTRPRTPVPLGALPSRTPAAKTPGRYEIRAAAEIAKTPAGSVVDGMGGLVEISARRLESLARAKSGRFTGGIAEIRRTARPEVFGADSDEAVINAVCNERSLPGGSLVAAGGWCSVSETLYDFCDTASEAGLVTIPTVTARRGGLRWPQSPDFSVIYNGTGFVYTEAEIIAQSTDKPCYEIPCPPMSEIRLDAIGLCLTVPILTNRAFPELVRYTMDQAMAAHAHRMNARVISKMVALAIANTVATGTAPFAYGPGALATTVSILELQAEWIRYRRRLDPNTSMEVKLPLWLRGVLRSDLVKRNGVDLGEKTDAELERYFTVRKMAVEWLYDWQDALATGSAGDFGGGATPPDVWPTTATALIAPAGTYFMATDDIITVDGLYDSALLKRNMQMALFTEQGFQVGKRCNDAVAVTFPICASGATGQQVEVACPSA